MLWSASSLKAHCAHVNVLSRLRKPSESSQLAMDKGTKFHAAVESWIKTGEVPQIDDDEVRGWFDLLVSQWTPPPGCMVEVAWGLTPEMRYCEVEEPEPHKYVRKDGGELLTAGRADLVSISRGVVIVADWKTGRWPVTPANKNLQLAAAGIAFCGMYGAVCFDPAIYYAQNGEWDQGYTIIVSDVEKDVRAAALLDGSPVVGDHCGNCWERKNCKAYKESVK